MPKSMTEQLGERATDALHEAIRIAWQAGYDQALMDLQAHEQRVLTLVREDKGEWYLRTSVVVLLSMKTIKSLFR
jgi:uncharacterized protein (DUF2267 family)